jgi:hypothetical protein
MSGTRSAASRSQATYPALMLGWGCSAARRSRSWSPRRTAPQSTARSDHARLPTLAASRVPRGPPVTRGRRSARSPGGRLSRTPRPRCCRGCLSARGASASGRRPTPLAAQRGRRTPVGTVVRYRLSEPATVRLRIERAVGGRRAGGSCRKATRRLRKRPRRTRYVRAGRTITRGAPAGANRLVFSGRIGRKPLRPARYRGKLSAVDAAMNVSATRSPRFRVVRARPR